MQRYFIYVPLGQELILGPLATIGGGWWEVNGNSYWWFGEVSLGKEWQYEGYKRAMIVKDAA